MLNYCIAILCWTFLASIIDRNSEDYNSIQETIKTDTTSKFLFVVIVIWMLLFAGLRTSFNDTYTYIRAFIAMYNGPLSFKDLLDGYGGFVFFQKFLKNYISKNPQVFIFFCSAITTGLCISTIKDFGKYFAGSIFLFSIGLFTSSMAAVKQVISISLSFVSLKMYLNRKYFLSLVFFLLGITFHPYIICLLCIPYLRNKIWDRRTILILVIIVLMLINIEYTFGFLEIIGKDYSEDIAFSESTHRINPLRVAIEFIPILLSLIYRDDLNESDNSLLIIGINMHIISFVFIVCGLFIDPIYMGRMATYFSSLSMITVPIMLHIITDNKRNGSIYRLIYYLFFFIYFVLDLTKLNPSAIFIDSFRHTSIMTLFR